MSVLVRAFEAFERAGESETLVRALRELASKHPQPNPWLFSVDELEVLAASLAKRDNESVLQAALDTVALLGGYLELPPTAFPTGALHTTLTVPFVLELVLDPRPNISASACRLARSFISSEDGQARLGDGWNDFFDRVVGLADSRHDLQAANALRTVVLWSWRNEALRARLYGRDPLSRIADLLSHADPQVAEEAAHALTLMPLQEDAVVAARLQFWHPQIVRSLFALVKSRKWLLVRTATQVLHCIVRLPGTAMDPMFREEIPDLLSLLDTGFPENTTESIVQLLESIVRRDTSTGGEFVREAEGFSKLVALLDSPNRGGIVASAGCVLLTLCQQNEAWAEEIRELGFYHKLFACVESPNCPGKRDAFFVLKGLAVRDGAMREALQNKLLELFHSEHEPTVQLTIEFLFGFVRSLGVPWDEFSTRFGMVPRLLSFLEPGRPVSPTLVEYSATVLFRLAQRYPEVAHQVPNVSLLLPGLLRGSRHEWGARNDLTEVFVLWPDCKMSRESFLDVVGAVWDFVSLRPSELRGLPVHEIAMTTMGRILNLWPPCKAWLAEHLRSSPMFLRTESASIVGLAKALDEQHTWGLFKESVDEIVARNTRRNKERRASVNWRHALLQHPEKDRLPRHKRVQHA